MGDFAIVTCLENREADAYKKNCFYLFWRFLNHLRHRQKIEDMLREGTKTIVLFEEDGALQVHHILLPFQLSELDGLGLSKRKKIENYIREYCTSNHIHTIMMPEKLRENRAIGSFAFHRPMGGYLFKALFLNILHEVYSKRGIKIRELDIAIVQGKSREELLFYLKLLAPMVRYLTVISMEKEEIEQKSENIYEETGLCIRVTDDYKNGLKNADFIVNLGGVPVKRTRPGAVVLDYGGMDYTLAASDSIIIRGIEVRLPAEIKSKLGNRIYEALSNNELTETILSHRLGIEKDPDVPQDEFEIYEKISKEFSREAYAITGLVGRHNLIKAVDIKLPVRLQKASNAY